jgi:hypothetical protein
VLIFLYFGVLVYHTYSVVLEQYLPGVNWGVTLTMNVSEDVYMSKVDFCLSHVVKMYILLVPVVNSSLF